MGQGGTRPVKVAWPAAGGAVCVGFSGGLDSTVLLHVLGGAAREGGHELAAVHVHHGLSPNADRWEAFCRETCDALGVPLDVVRVKIDAGSGLGIEAEARRARYAVYAARREPFVALAHHRDDQAESVMLQLLRGTGVKGAAAMPVLRPLHDRVSLWRPLLECSRADLEAYAASLGLRWIDDESNASLEYDRNFVRHRVAPSLDARFPGWRQALARFAGHAAQSQELLDALAAIDGATRERLAIRADTPPGRAANALRAFIAMQGLAAPSEARLAEMVRQLYGARSDASIAIEHDGRVLTRYRGEVLVEAPAQALPRVAWRGERRVDLGEAIGCVDFEDAVGSGVALERTRDGDWFVGPREGGERMRLSPRGRTRTLKNLLQERGVAPGQRLRMPLLFHEERLVWAPGVGIAAGYACAPQHPGLRPVWTVAGKTPLC